MRFFIAILFLLFPVVSHAQEITPMRAVRKYNIGERKTAQQTQDSLKTQLSEPKNNNDSLTWVKVDTNSTYYQNKIAWRFYNGDKYIKKNDAEALRLWNKSANGGYAPAQIQLGLLYRYGDIVPQDNKKAVEWFTKAVNQGNTDAMMHLANCFAFGLGVKEDDKKAIELYTQAAVTPDNMLYFAQKYY